MSLQGNPEHDMICNHLMKLANEVTSVCPMLSRLYRLKSKEVMNKKDKNDGKYIFKECSFCSNMFTPGNHKIQLLPKPKFTRKILRLKQRQDRGEYSMMGKFQRKLLQDDTGGRNRVMIKCELCGKSRTVDGQTRQQLEIQRKQRALLKQDSETVKVLTRKDRKKERKKLLKKKYRDGEIDDDKHAGLTLPGEMNNTKISEQCRESDDLAASHSRVGMNENNPGSLKPAVGIMSRNLPADSGDLASVITPETTQKKQAQSLTSNSTNFKPVNIPKNAQTKNVTFPTTAVSSVSSTSERKNKVKMKGRQLSQMLKKEQTKHKEGTLADFLSNL